MDGGARSPGGEGGEPGDGRRGGADRDQVREGGLSRAHVGEGGLGQTHVQGLPQHTQSLEPFNWPQH